MANPPDGRIAPLDGLRAVAVLMVVVYHATVFERGGGPFSAALLKAARFGWSGVDLFFVLSGFLITGILRDERGAENYFRAFYSRRFLRIFPLYYLSLAALVLLYRVPPSESTWYWLYLSNVKATLDGWPAAPLSHFWSLAVEEQYYLVWPLLVFSLSRRALLALCVAIVAIVPAMRTAAWFAGSSEIGLYTLTWFRLDALAAGSALALLVRSAPRARLRSGAWATGVASATAMGGIVVRGGGDPNWTSPLVLTVGLTLVALLFASFLALTVTASADSPAARLLGARGLRRIGEISYGIYVFHWPVTSALRGAGFVPAALGPGPLGWVVYLAGIAAAVTGLALLSWKSLEAPCLAWKRRFVFRRAAGELPPY